MFVSRYAKQSAQDSGAQAAALQMVKWRGRRAYGALNLLARSEIP
jgi:hypothetical protein